MAVKIDAHRAGHHGGFAPATDAGWHTGAAPVTLAVHRRRLGRAEGRNGPRRRPVDGVHHAGQRDRQRPHELLYQATDAAGNLETLKSAILKIDGTAPTVIVSGLADGQLYGDSQDVRVPWQAVDPVSGIRSSVRVAGRRRLPDRHPAGHLRAPTRPARTGGVATDNAGNATTSTVRFFVTTSFRDMQNLLDRFKATSRLSTKAYRQLSNELAKARKAEANGNDQRGPEGARRLQGR